MVKAARCVLVGLMFFGLSACGSEAPDASVTAVRSISMSTDSLDLSGPHLIYCSNAYPAPISITEYDFWATGDAHPLATIAGPDTGILAGVGGLAVDSEGYLYAATTNTSGVGAILVFAPGANGDVSPVRTITAQSYGGVFSAAVALDSSDDVWVGNTTTASIEEFAAGANGDVAPIRTIAGSKTELVRPFDLAIDRRGNVWVADPSAEKLLMFAAGASGNVAPRRVISGAATRLTVPASVGLDGQGGVWVANESFIPPGMMYGFHTSDNGDVAPSVALDASPDQYAPNGGPAFLDGDLVFPGLSGGQQVVLDTFTDTLSGTPQLLRTISGRETKLGSTGFITIH